VVLEVRVAPGSAVPLWHQIELGLRRLVGAGTLGPGAKVPSVRDLAAELRVNPATVVKAYQALVDAGVLVVRRGEGTFVGEAPPAASRAERRQGLRDAAAQFVGAARAAGATEEQAVREVRVAWPPAPRDGERRLRPGDDGGPA
jgi:GntR family transcriptional regulator